MAGARAPKFCAEVVLGKDYIVQKFWPNRISGLQLIGSQTFNLGILLLENY